MKCTHPKSWRVEIRDNGDPHVEWCKRCGAFRHFIEELIGLNAAALASFETRIIPNQTRKRGEEP